MRDKIPNIKDYAPVGTKSCEAICDRQVIPGPKSVKVVCHGCKRIVRETIK